MLAVSAAAAATPPKVTGKDIPATAISGMVSSWHTQLQTVAAWTYPSPKLPVLQARLQQAASEYGFEVVGIDMRYDGEFAPLVVIQGTNRAALARATPAIMDLIDPITSGGWRAYIGFLLEIRDSHGVPFAAVWRTGTRDPGGYGGAGGEWATEPRLFPYPPDPILDVPRCGTDATGKLSTKAKPCTQPETK